MGLGKLIPAPYTWYKRLSVIQLLCWRWDCNESESYTRYYRNIDQMVLFAVPLRTSNNTVHVSIVFFEASSCSLLFMNTDGLRVDAGKRSYCKIISYLHNNKGCCVWWCKYRTHESTWARTSQKLLWSKAVSSINQQPVYNDRKNYSPHFFAQQIRNGVALIINCFAAKKRFLVEHVFLG